MTDDDDDKMTFEDAPDEVKAMARESPQIMAQLKFMLVLYNSDDPAAMTMEVGELENKDTGQQMVGVMVHLDGHTLIMDMKSAMDFGERMVEASKKEKAPAGVPLLIQMLQTVKGVMNQ